MTTANANARHFREFAIVLGRWQVALAESVGMRVEKPPMPLGDFFQAWIVVRGCAPLHGQ